MNSLNKGFFIIYVATVLLAINPLFAKWIILPAVSIIWGRSLVASIVLGTLHLLKNPGPMNLKPEHRVPLLITMFLGGANFVFFYYSIQVSSVGIGISLLMTHPVITSILEPLYQKKPIQIQQLIYAALIVLAVGILSDVDMVTGSAIQGVIWGGISALCFSIRNILIKPLTTHYPSRSLMGLQMICATICLLPFSFPMMKASATEWTLVIIVGVIGTALAHTLLIKSLEYLSSTTSGIISTLQVPIAILLAVISFNEEVTWKMGIAAFMIVLTAILEQLDHLKKDAT